MSFEVSQASNYVANNSRKIGMRSVLDSVTGKLLIKEGSYQTGIKGEEFIKRLAFTPSFQSGTGCARTASGDISLSDKKIKTVRINQYTNICSDDLWSTPFSIFLNEGQSPTEEFNPELINQVTDKVLAEIAWEVEKLLWQSIEGSTGVTANLRHINGFLQYASGATMTATGTTAGTTYVEKLHQVFLATPVAVTSKPDYYIFMGNDTFNTYKTHLAGKNIYQPVDDLTVFGTTAKIIVTPGLAGTGKVFSGRLSNLHLGLDGSGDWDAASFKQSSENDTYYLDVKFATGVQIINEDEVKVASGF